MNRHFLTILSFTGLVAFSPASRADATFTLNESAALQSLQAGQEKPSLQPSTGGFFARDVNAGAELDFSKGTLKKSGDKSVYEASASGIDLHAEFVPQDGYVLVNGVLKNSRKDDRAIILDYRVGLNGKGAVFSNALNKSEESTIADETSEYEGNAFPVGALDGGKSSVSIAIPPLEPRSFGVVGSAKGLAIRFYLGITPLTKAFPNEASFSFIVYPSQPGWGFRGALQKYYGFFPARYEHEPKQIGNYLYMGKGVVPENIDQYSFSVLEIQSPDVVKDLARDDKHNIASLLYTLVGQREIKFLDKLPENYDEALKAFSDWTVESHKKHPVTKENAVAGEDAWLRAEVENSAVKDAEGKYVLLLRKTPWGKNSVSFKVNPSPYLFKDRDVDTVGRNSIRLVNGWLKQYPQIDGVTVDSLGANWPATPNYRRDHFEYAQYPLTFDSQGRLFLHNENSHFEWVKYVHDELAPQGKYLFANGVYAYRTQVSEHYLAKDKKARIKLGRFFISSLLNGAASEAGARATTDRCQDVRIMMGHKYYSLTNYDWEEKDKVNAFYNRALAYGIFASNTKNYFGGGDYVEGVHEGISYLDNPHGYFRDKALIDWFVPKAILLHKAGWQPVTFAQASGGANLYLERYGSGDKVYFTVFNDSDQKVETTLTVDLKGLGCEQAKFQEIARDAKLEPAGSGVVKLTLEPFSTYIVAASGK